MQFTELNYLDPQEDIMNVEITVRHHPSGNYTLTERSGGEKLATDVQTPGLFMNPDATSFYKAVAARLAAHHAGGRSFTYRDTN